MEKIVHDNLNNAVAGGYTSIREWTPEQIVDDLLSYASDCGDKTPDELLPHVRTWLEKNRV